MQCCMCGGLLLARPYPAHFAVSCASNDSSLDADLPFQCSLRSCREVQNHTMQVADELAGEMRVLALDEFFVTDVADAVILNRLFSRLWELGMVLVSTSNRAPDALYEGGLQRVLFLPFIDRLKVSSSCFAFVNGHDLAGRQHEFSQTLSTPLYVAPRAAKTPVKSLSECHRTGIAASPALTQPALRPLVHGKLL